MRFLIVDDTRSVHRYLEILLKPFVNAELTNTYSAAEALAVLQKGQSFDMILLDWEMPEMNGIALLKHLRQNQIETPVLMMTTKNSIEDVREALESGATEFMMKPFTIDIFREKVSGILGQDLQHVA